MHYDRTIWIIQEKENLDTKETLSIVFNGEIYNHKEIKEELIEKWYHFTSQTDTEVILASYLERGENCVTHFNGMRAFVIYDESNKKIFGSRDRLGKKPFYYYHDNTQFIFSSELKGILASGIERKINIAQIPEFLSFHYTPREQTLVKNVFKLPAGNSFVYNLITHNFSITSYREITIDAVRYTDFQQAKSTLDTLLHDAVKLRTENSDVPVWTFLSWGIDSSLTSALFKQYYQGKEFHTFNVVREERLWNESEFAEIVAKHIGSTHHKYTITGKDVAQDIYKLQEHYSDPVAEAWFIPNYFVSKYARDYVKVVLTWDGADEIFAWYSYYNFLQKLWKIGHIPWVRIISKIFWKILPPSKYQKWFELLSFASRANYDKFFGLTVSNFSQKELSKLLTDKFQQKANYFQAIAATVKSFRSFLNQLLFTDQQVLLQYCYNLKPDHALMAHGLEGRAPFQDYRLLEFAYQIPDNFKIHRWKEKHILYEIAKDYLPPEITARKKQGYGVPIFEWINGDLKDIITEKLHNSQLVHHGYLHQSQIDYYLDNLHNKYLSTRIRTLFSLELYIEVYQLTID